VFAYKFMAVVAGRILGIAVVAALAHAPTNSEDGRAFAAAKSNLADNQPGCPKIAWPYGCEWHPPAHPINKHFLVQQRRHHYSLFGRGAGGT
jgi:hypothetical protein